MRAYARSVLLVLALAAPAQAAPYDGAENTGLVCQSVFADYYGGYNHHTGVIAGGTWVAADLIENNNGIVGVESRPGLATEMRITCSIHVNSSNGTLVVTTSSSLPAGSGVVHLAPQVFAFESSYNTFVTCTLVEWTDTDGTRASVRRCGEPQQG